MRNSAGVGILRGSIVGILLGVVGGMSIATINHMNKRLDAMSEAVATAKADGGLQYDEVLQNTDSIQNTKDSVIRFHVKANSNSDEDIALKMMVRDAVLGEIGTSLRDSVDSYSEAIDYLEDNISLIEEISEKTIERMGYDYEVKAYITTDYFPIRQYGEMVLPAGNYKALRIDIGEAKGENFWCILYPISCYTSTSAAVVSREDGKVLEKSLSKEDYERLFVNRDLNKGDVKVKFKFLEILGIE